MSLIPPPYGLLNPGDDHFYISTYCLHGNHAECGAKQAARGEPGPPHCKECPSICACPTCRHLETGR